MFTEAAFPEMFGRISVLMCLAIIGYFMQSITISQLRKKRILILNAENE